MDLIKQWKLFLMDINKTEVQVANEVEQTQQVLNRKIRKQSIRYTELSNIVEKYGYSIDIHKKEDWYK